MKKQVRWAAFLLALSVMAGSFAGCGENKDTESSASGSTPSGNVDSDNPGGSDNSDHLDNTDSNTSATGSNASGTNSNTSATGNNAGGTNSAKTNSNGGTNQGGNTGTNQGGNTGTNQGGSNALANVETKGKTFTIISPFMSAKRTNNMDLYNELLLERAEEVEKELGCTIKIVTTVKPTADWLAPQVRAGKKVADLLHIEMKHLVPFVSAGYIKAWNDVTGVNVNDANYNQAVTKVSTIKGKTYGVSMLKPEEVRYCGIINKTLLQKYGINPNEIYKKIDNGTWTFDALLQYAQQIQSKDSFKGNAIDADPRYLIEMLMAANNARIVTMDQNGNATPTYNSANAREAAQFMYDIVYKHKLYNPKRWMANEVAGPDQFIKGNVAFLFDEAWVVAKKVKQNVKNFDYGLIMLPKGPKATGYVSGLEHANMFVTTSTNKELGFTAKVLTALSKPPKGLSGSQWWLDEAELDLLQSNDKQSMKIYKQCLASPTIDYGMCLVTLTNAFKDAVLENAIMQDKVTVSAAFDSINGTLDGTIKDVFGKLGK